MLHTHRTKSLPLPRFALAACASLLFPLAAAVAQSSSSSSNTSTGQAGTPPGQTGTTAAPGTAPIRSRATANAITPQRVPTYDERFELFGGLSFMNGQAGQNLPKRYNMGGGEVMGTYWLGRRLGVAGDYRLEAGTTPILPTPQLAGTRALVIQNIVSGGVNFRGPKNRYAAIDLHALVGASRGSFDRSIKNDPDLAPNTPPTYFGLYNNSTTPWGAAGGSIDFNYSPKIAIRLSPDMLFEHFGTETREFFSIGGGVVYRFGKRR